LILRKSIPQNHLLMDSIDSELLQVSSEWIADERSCELVTVIKTWGLSPRPEGATPVIGNDGRVVGSVSGDCIEDDLIDRVRREGMSASCLKLSPTALWRKKHIGSDCHAVALFGWRSNPSRKKWHC
jgi:xanthine/CO dehydrogenase XdhC/CoxF family maturation factor